MAKRKKKPDGKMSLDDGFKHLLGAAEEEAKQNSGFYSAKEIADRARYIDFWDLSKDRPCLPLEYLYGTRGFICGRLVKYDSNEQAGKSSVMLMNVGMAQRTSGAWPCIWETEDTVPPPDYINWLGCDPDKLLFKQPDTIFECLEQITGFIRQIRKDVDKDKRYPLILGIDSVSSLGADAVDVDENSKKSNQSLGLHAREFSKYFREKYKLIGREDGVLFATAQLKDSINTGFGGGTGSTTIAAKPFAFHASWRVTIYHTTATDSNSGQELGEWVKLFTSKNKLSEKHRMCKILLRRQGLVPDGETMWDFELANKDLLTGPTCPFTPEEFTSSANGWYSHVALNDGKSMRLPDFLDAFYASEELVMQVRERLKIRGFGFKFEEDYRRSPAAEEEDDGAES